MCDRGYEALAVEYLSDGLVPLGAETFTNWRAHSIDVPLREIAASALALQARAIIVAHNHPNGDHRPSAADIAATRKLARLCRDLEIALHDHVIIAGGNRYSFREEGLL